MLASLGAVSTLLISVMLVMTGLGMQFAALPLRSQIEGFSGTEIGAAASAYSVGLVIGCLVCPYGILRAGHIRAFAAFISVASVVTLLHIIVVDPWAWALFRMLSGFCIAGFYLCIESWLNDRATNEMRGFVLSAYVVVLSVGVIFGQVAVALGDVTTFLLFAIASIIVSLAVVPLSMTRSAQPAPIMLVRLRPRRLYRNSPAAFVSIFLVGVTTGSILTLSPIYATATGHSVQFAALFSASVFAGGALLQWPLGRTSDLTDRRKLLAVSALGAIVAGFALTRLGGYSPYLLLGLAALLGGFTQPGYAIAGAHAYDHAEREDYVETSSGLLIMYAIGAAVGPIIAATAMEKAGPNALIYFVAAVQAIMVIYLMTRMRIRPGLAPERKEDFDLGSSTPVVAMGIEDPWEQDEEILIPAEYEERQESEEADAADPESDANGPGPDTDTPPRP